MAYLPLSTANLPDPVIDPAQGASPEDYFNTVLTTSTGSTLSVDVGFAADFLWTKARNFGRHHELHDRVRGDNVRLKSSETSAEESYTNYVVFDADGADLGTNHNLGYHAGGTTTGVVWAWKANGSGVTNTDGSITSTVSANTTSGFSIVSYTGNNTAGATVGHGLDQAPDVVIVKNRDDGTRGWMVYHSANTSAPATDYLFLNSTNATSDYDGAWNDTAPTSTVFSIGNSNETNQNTADHIAYCFHSVEGFSKFGSYVGNGSADGPFVYTGFRPAFVMFKRTNTTSSWSIYDAERDSHNFLDSQIYANLSNAETTNSTYAVDFVSNGFKHRTSNASINNTGDTYIYMAFAEQPIKFSNAR